MSLFVIRPGETDFDIQFRVQGSLDLPLNERGERQLIETLESLRNADLDIVYASPTEPAQGTARRIATYLDRPLRVVDELTNLDLGLWQGKTLAEIRARQPRVYRQWAEAPESVYPPGGESPLSALERVTSALQKPLRQGRSFAVVACEPLATLISSVLQGTEPDIPGPKSRSSVPRLIERILPLEPQISASVKNGSRQKLLEFS